MHVNELLARAVDQGASVLHLKAGGVPMLRVRGSLVPMADTPRLQAVDLDGIATAVLTPSHSALIGHHQDVDLAYTVPGLGRFRCNVFQQRGAVGLVFRVIPQLIPGFDALGLPAVLSSIAAEERGLVLVTGTTGSGKSTTLAALVDAINQARTAHIVTIEDPIEYLHQDRQSVINQREIGIDTASFATALRSALRQDPDVILVGEMRDHATIETALMAAETGHLVLSTLHTLDATETINRIIGVFPAHQQPQIRLQLATVLKAIVAQRLIPRADGQSRAAAVEVLIATPFIRDAIADPARTHLVQSAIAQGGSQYGMQTFDQAIFGLYESGSVSLDEARRWASNVDEFMLRVQGIGSGAASAGGAVASPDITRFSK